MLTYVTHQKLTGKLLFSNLTTSSHVNVCIHNDWIKILFKLRSRHILGHFFHRSIFSVCAPSFFPPLSFRIYSV